MVEQEMETLSEAEAKAMRLYIGAAKPVTLTQAEYDALSAPEQADETILYLITD